MNDDLASRLGALLDAAGGPYAMTTDPDGSVRVVTRGAPEDPSFHGIDATMTGQRQTGGGRFMTTFGRQTPPAPAAPAMAAPAPVAPDMPSAPPARKKNRPDALPPAPAAVKKGRPAAPRRPLAVQPYDPAGPAPSPSAPSSINDSVLQQIVQAFAIRGRQAAAASRPRPMAKPAASPAAPKFAPIVDPGLTEQEIGRLLGMTTDRRTREFTADNPLPQGMDSRTAAYLLEKYLRAQGPGPEWKRRASW